MMCARIFEAEVQIPRIRHDKKQVKKQTIEDLINEKALLFDKFLRNERRDRISRYANITYARGLFFS